jgi:hypothetical protein
MALAVLGGALGLAIAWSSQYRPAAAWAVWALVVTALTSASGAAWGYGLRRWRELAALTPIRIRDVAAPIGGMWVTAALFGAALQVVSLPSSGRWEWRAGLLLVTAGLGVLPATATIAAGGIFPTDVTDDVGTRYQQLVRIRRILHGVLAVLAGIIALLVVAAATAAKMNHDASVIGSVLFGAFMSALVAIVYLPTSAKIRERSARLVDEVLPTCGLTGKELAERAEQRGKLEVALGVDKSVFSDLQTNLIVLGPLATSAAAAFLAK